MSSGLKTSMSGPDKSLLESSIRDDFAEDTYAPKGCRFLFWGCPRNRNCVDIMLCYSVMKRGVPTARSPAGLVSIMGFDKGFMHVVCDRYLER